MHTNVNTHAALHTLKPKDKRVRRNIKDSTTKNDAKDHCCHKTPLNPFVLTICHSMDPLSAPLKTILAWSHSRSCCAVFFMGVNPGGWEDRDPQILGWGSWGFQGVVGRIVNGTRKTL